MPRFASTFRVNFDAKFASKFYVSLILVQNFVGLLTMPAGGFPSSSVSNTTSNVWKMTRELDCCGDEQQSSAATNSSENENSNSSSLSHPRSASVDDKLLIEFYKLYVNLYEKRLLDDESMQADQSPSSASSNGSIFDAKTNTTDDHLKHRREM